MMRTMNSSSLIEQAIAGVVAETIISIIDEELDKCLICDRDSVSGRTHHYCSKHFFAEQMINKKLN